MQFDQPMDGGPQAARVSAVAAYALAAASSARRIVAPDKEAAIEKAVEEFRIEPARRFRLIAEPVEQRRGISTTQRAPGTGGVLPWLRGVQRGDIKSASSSALAARRL